WFHRETPRLQLPHDGHEIAHALFQHQATEEEDDHVIVAESCRPAPFHVAALRIEQLTVDAPTPKARPRITTKLPQLVDDAGRRSQHMFAAPVETPQMRLRQRPRPAQAIMFEIGLEP